MPSDATSNADRNTKTTQRSSRDQEIERLSRYPVAPYCPGEHTDPSATGVLLSDQIEYYCENFKLLDPFLKANLKPAAYELRVGFQYSVEGRTRELQVGQELVIPKFTVGVIEILETVNMPNFLIGRWNIRTKWAYKGLIWVGGPQVDPGYRGILLCPIWNLSNSNFRIKCGDPIAVMDFVTTTRPTTASLKYDWRSRNRVVFDDYDPDLLKSGLVTDAVDAIRAVKQDADTVRNRVDSFIAVTFTALAVLITAVTLFATKPQALTYWWDPTVFWLCVGAILVALLAWVRSRERGRWTLWVELAVLVVGISGLGLLGWRTHRDLRQLNERIHNIEQRGPQAPSQRPDAVRPGPTPTAVHR